MGGVNGDSCGNRAQLQRKRLDDCEAFMMADYGENPCLMQCGE